MPYFVAAYVHNEGQAGALVQIRHRESTSARTKELQELGRELAMQVVAMKPAVVLPSEIDEVAWRKHLAGLRGTSMLQAPSTDRLSQLREAREAYERSFCLLKQAFVKNHEITIEERVEQVASQLSEKLEVVRFALFDGGAAE